MIERAQRQHAVGRVLVQQARGDGIDGSIATTGNQQPGAIRQRGIDGLAMSLSGFITVTWAPIPCSRNAASMSPASSVLPSGPERALTMTGILDKTGSGCGWRMVMQCSLPAWRPAMRRSCALRLCTPGNRAGPRRAGRHLFDQEVDEHAHGRQQATTRREHSVSDALRQAPLRQHDFELAVAHLRRAHRVSGNSVMPTPCSASRPQHRKIETRYARLQFDASHFAIGAMQLPTLPRFVLVDAQRDVCGEFAGIGRSTHAVEVASGWRPAIPGSGRSCASPGRRRRPAGSARAARRRSLR